MALNLIQLNLSLFKDPQAPSVLFFVYCFVYFLPRNELSYEEWVIQI